MCIIIYRPKGATLKDSIYEECFRINDDGVGFAYVDPEKKRLIVEKGFMKKEEALAAIKAKDGLEMLIHFRRVSRGGVSKDNCHPFYASSNDDENGVPRYEFAIAHNGTFPYHSTANQSDTSCFMEEIMAPWLERDPYLLESKHSHWILQEWMQPRNKVVAFRYDTKEDKLDVVFFNKTSPGANEAQGCWFSNYSWLPLSNVNGTGDRGYPMGGYGYGGMYGGYENDWEGRDHTNHRKPHIDVINPHKKPPADGEISPDHNGWIWRASKKMFEHVTTKNLVPELSYRKPMETKYVQNGIEYDRLCNAYSRPVSTVVPTQTTLPGLHQQDKAPLSLMPGGHDSGLPAKDPDLMDDDEWARSYGLAKALQDCSMPHLDKKQKRELKRMAVDFCRATYGEESIDHMKINDLVGFLRHEWLETFPEAKKLTIAQIDKALLNMGLKAFAANDDKTDEGVTADAALGAGGYGD